MVGSFVTRALILVLGYAYPAYDCYKTVELNRPEFEQLRFWCQYWILLAVLTLFERVADNFVSWLPMYSEAKLAFIVYLWYPKTRGTAYVYDSFFKPYIAKHESEIDRNLLELRTRVGDMAVSYFQKISTYGQTRFYEILQYIASQSQSPRSRSQPQHQQQQPAPARTSQVNLAPALTPVPSAPPQPQQPPRVPPTLPRNPTQEGPPLPTAPPGAASPAQPHAPLGPEAVADYHRGTETMQVDSSGLSASKELNPTVEETIMEEAIRMTRGRLRRRTVGSGPSAPPPS